MSKWNVGVYLRLSNDDGDKDESNSITNQKYLIQDYLSNYKDIKIYNYYIDDGFTGTDFNRPGFQKLLEDIRDKYVDTVIVKALSRLGRNYTEVGTFLEQTIPLYNLRFISINDHVDSYAIPESMNTLEIPFKNLMNENYAKDISDKIRSSHVIRKQNGDYIGVIAPYGYIKDPKDCHKLLIDEEVAPYIKKIFDLALKGNSRQDIIKELNRLNIPTPSMYFKLKYNLKNKRVAYEWNLNAIDRIIKNETYIGNLVQGKTKRVSHKIHNIVRRPEEEWIRAKKTHKPIIDEKTFKIVNDIFYLRGNLVNNKGKLHTYSGHLKCADCGANLTISRKDKDGAIRYYCSSYKNKKICSRHYISEKHLNNLVLTTFNKYINLLCNIEEKVNEVLIGTKLKYNEEINRIKKIDINKEINKYQVLVDELLKDYEADLINKEELENYNRLYLGKINKLRIELQELESSKSSSINEDWIKKFKDKKEVDVIDRNIVIEFIDNIYVYEDGNIKIVFKNNDEYLETIKFLKSHNCVV